MARIIAINLVEWNSTQSEARPNSTYQFTVPSSCGNATAARLIADGSDAKSGITFNGFSYDVALDNGNPVKLSNSTLNEPVSISGGTLELVVPHSSAAVVSLTC